MLYSSCVMSFEYAKNRSGLDVGLESKSK